MVVLVFIAYAALKNIAINKLRKPSRLNFSEICIGCGVMD